MISYESVSGGTTVAFKPEKAEVGIAPRMKEAEDERAGAEEEVEA